MRHHVLTRDPRGGWGRLLQEAELKHAKPARLDANPLSGPFEGCGKRGLPARQGLPVRMQIEIEHGLLELERLQFGHHHLGRAVSRKERNDGSLRKVERQPCQVPQRGTGIDGETVKPMIEQGVVQALVAGR